MTYDIVTAEFVREHLGGMPIVDVRPTPMYEEGRIPGALSVPLMETRAKGGDVAGAMAEQFRALGIDEETAVIVYCMNGTLAHEACDLLESQGFVALNCYEGSWLDWTSEPGNPIEE